MSRRRFLEQLLGLVDLGREVGAPAAVGVVEEHQRAVRLADLVTADTALSVGP